MDTTGQFLVHPKYKRNVKLHYWFKSYRNVNWHLQIVGFSKGVDLPRGRYPVNFIDEPFTHFHQFNFPNILVSLRPRSDRESLEIFNFLKYRSSLCPWAHILWCSHINASEVDLDSQFFFVKLWCIIHIALKYIKLNWAFLKSGTPKWKKWMNIYTTKKRVHKNWYKTFV